MNAAVDYTAPPTVAQMLRSDARVRVIMGPIGSGKSSGCVMEILRRAMQQEPGRDGIRRTRWAIIRNTYPQLRDTTQKTFEQWIPAQLGKWNNEEYSFTLRFHDVEAEVLFRALDRPEDEKKVLSLELTGAYLNELREIPQAIFDAIQGRVGRYPQMLDGGPTWFGVWGDTNPWHTGHWGQALFEKRPEGMELYRQPGGRSAQAENLAYLPPGYYLNLCAGKDAEWIAVYVDGEVASHDVGSVYGRALDLLRQRGGICHFNFTSEDIFTSWDLGIGDSTAIWFWQLAPHGADVLDHYENYGLGLSHYFEVLDQKAQEKGYRYARHWLPHDARAKTLQTGVSTLDHFLSRFGPSRVAITPGLSVADGLGAGRWLLEQPGTRIHAANCELGLKALQEYRYAWSEETRAFSRKPLHDWASNSADAFRYLALVVKATEEMLPKPKPPPLGEVKHYGVTLDELWKMNEREGRI